MWHVFRLTLKCQTWVKFLLTLLLLTGLRTLQNHSASTFVSIKKIILCVDDEKVVLTSLIGQLNNAFGTQYIYEGFTSPEDALEYLQELRDEGSHPDVIISDWLMPRLRGDEFLIQARALFPKARLLMLSGQADASSVEHTIKEANLFQFMAKPWDKDELMRQVELAIAS
jgi:CheY-like chemotaxis protein